MMWLLLLCLLVGACGPAAPARDSSLARRESAASADAPDSPVVEDVTDHPRVALVIGNGGYQEVTELENPPRNARHVAARLAEFGFDVELVIDADRASMLDAIANLGQRSKAAARDQAKPVGLFYFSGHGVQYQGKNYLIPVRARVSELSDIPAQLVDVNYAIETLRDAGNPFNIVVLDAGRDNSYTDDSPGARGLAFMAAPERTLLAYATAPGQVARDRDQGKIGVFTQALLRHVARPGAAVAEVLDAVAADVEQQTGGEQVPWSSLNFKGKFAFSPGSTQVECDRGTWNGEQCVLEKLACPPGFEMIPDQGCRIE